MSKDWLTTRRLIRDLTIPTSRTSKRSARRPTRSLLAHMRALQALDATLAGASHRDIGAAIFGSEAIMIRWHPDSELRAQVRHLIRRGRVLVNGGYRRLLAASGTGRIPTH
jgi:hypothetical protein